MVQTNRSNLQVDEANKYIFVKAYEQAERILEDLTHSEAYRNDLLLHLRRIELATKLDSLTQLRKSYENLLAGQPENLVYQIALIFIEQHGEFATAKLLPVQSQCVSSPRIVAAETFSATAEAPRCFTASARRTEST